MDYLCEEYFLHSKTEIMLSQSWAKEEMLKRFKQEMTLLQRIQEYERINKPGSNDEF